MEIWSIFKRNRDGKNVHNIRHDGNPLIYAFKEENNWYFASNKDKNAILNQIYKILQKFEKLHPFNTTIMIPSRSQINTMLANMYLEINSDADIIKGVLLKMTTNEVFDEVSKPSSAFVRYYGDDVEDALDRLSVFLDKMDEDNDGIFSYHAITDSKMSNCIEKNSQNL